MTKLLLVRHGETDWNAERRWQGHSDTPLNEAGREQARRLADELDAVDAVDAVYASDLARARETAEILARRLGLEVVLDPRLRERGFGSWEGLTMAEIETRFAEEARRWRDEHGHGAADAEPHDVFLSRVESFVDEILDRHPGQHVLVVAHGGTIRAVHALAGGLDYVRDHASIPSVANCSVARYAFQDGKLARID